MLNVTVDGTMMHSLRSDENDAPDDWQPIDYEKSTANLLQHGKPNHFLQAIHCMKLKSIWLSPKCSPLL